MQKNTCSSTKCICVCMRWVQIYPKSTACLWQVFSILIELSLPELNVAISRNTLCKILSRWTVSFQTCGQTSGKSLGSLVLAFICHCV